MHPDSKKSRFPLPLLLLGVGTVGALITGTAVIPMARAQSGRRICVYKDENANGNHLWSVVDYKKDGDPECPRLYSSEVADPGADPKKMTCEEFASLLGALSTPDPCPDMVDDHVYEITQNPRKRTNLVTDKGVYWKFQRSIRFHAYTAQGGVYLFCAATLDARGNELDSDCDRVGLNGTSRLFYRPGTVKVRFSLGTRSRANTRTVNVASGDGDARNYCVDEHGKASGAYTRERFC